MAWDLAHCPHTDLYVQACGDAHLCNFGVSATPERRLIFDLRDFDETLPAPWEWDVKRLAVSIVVAAREKGLSRARVRDAVLASARAYREGMRASLGLTYMEIYYLRVDAEEKRVHLDSAGGNYAKRLLAKARRRTSARELDKLTVTVDGVLRIKEEPPLIFPLEKTRRGDEDAYSALTSYATTLSFERRRLLEKYRFVDIAYKVVGVGSVGTRCLVALYLGDAEDDPLFLQIKEAQRSVLEPYVRRCQFKNQGERVVQGQRLLQAAGDVFLGWKSRGGHDFYIRQLKDMKGNVDIKEMPSRIIERYGQLCGRTLAHAHARSGDFCQIAGYLGVSDTFDIAIANFAEDYADQVERDYEALVKAARAGRLPVAA